MTTLIKILFSALSAWLIIKGFVADWHWALRLLSFAVGLTLIPYILWPPRVDRIGEE
jgi:hypothetical protein